ncbi:MAG: TetR/AcrR family transcriptional regulator [Chloroflexi bacterium]|nr:TetR/AcrR family transcriptional regulator [Chloroflexota bacterium]
MDERPSNRHEKRKRRTRRRITRAVIELVLEKGYDTVTIDDITERADVGRGTFYVHFHNKEDAVWGAQYDGFKELEIELEASYEPGSPRNLYRAWLAIFTYAGDHRDLFDVLLSGKGSAMLTERVESFLVERTLTGIREGVYDFNTDLPDRFVAEYAVGALTRVLSWWLQHDDAPPAAMADLMYRMTVGLEPPRPAA